MLGAIIGDIVGSIYESSPYQGTDFPLLGPHNRFTDDTVMTLAIARGIMDGGRPENYTAAMQELGRLYPDAGYGGKFYKWIFSPEPAPYGSWGNGGAMRVSPIAWWGRTQEEVLQEAAVSAGVTHNHPEGVTGAQATALAVFLSRQGWKKEALRAELSERFGFDLNRRVSDIRPGYQFVVRSKDSVPEAMICFLDSTGFEDAIRKAVSLGGDADTQATIAGSIAEAAYGIPPHLAQIPERYLTEDLLRILGDFLTFLEKVHKKYPR